MPRQDRKPERARKFSKPPHKQAAAKSDHKTFGGKPQPFGKPTHKTERKPFHKPHVKPESGLWLYGTHAVRAALANPKRFVKRAVLTERAAEDVGAKLLGRVRHELTDMHGVSKILPEGSVHQGVALLVEPLPRPDLDAVLAAAEPGKRRVVLVMDQITDPHNAGAILRTAAAFGVTAVVVQDRHSPPESGVLAKAASGALDVVPLVYEVNIARAMENLGKANFWRIALAGDGDTTLREAMEPNRDIALVLGSEGAGVRRLVRESCDVSAYVPIDATMESLNVSNAAAVALYEVRRG
ncbi:MAG: 23S rRNA (guanosine(2251)-2'-O)-methyltransferase RlmB [Alphaproteobacteria bacterium]|nr:23S rRNA (guanosine(2251)-2'-O)-methyltransferase RlmB [Alphaproteobacteria bacterium]MBL7099426.1 23S rRNA (guanosine(2251)-2'-O)-methyltransferase RlmB [Alphaproteobacteria bacterium]